MPRKHDNGLAGFNAALDRILKDAETQITPALVKGGNEFATMAKTLAESSRDTGALIDSIEVTPPGGTTPPYSQPGGSHVAGPTEVVVTAGNSHVRYAHLVEYGTADTEAQPFFWPAYRLLKKRIRNRINRAARKAVRDGWKGQ
jgi:HK97 gp10 family phage protein